jgi:hypothetical protein
VYSDDTAKEIFEKKIIDCSKGILSNIMLGNKFKVSIDIYSG